MNSLDPIPYSDAQLRGILQRVRTIAMVGASSNWNRPSFFVMKYLQGKGYRVIPVNPGLAGQTLLGETVYASLRDIPEHVDMVDVFRPPAEAASVARQAVACGATVLWFQLDTETDEAVRIATYAGLTVVTGHCLMVAHAALTGRPGTSAA